MLNNVVNDFIIDEIKTAVSETKCDFNDSDIVSLINLTRVEVLKVFALVPEESIIQSDQMINVLRNVIKVVVGKNLRIKLLQDELETSLLTGLPNQRAGIIAIKGLIQLKKTFCWTFFDLDRLKSINLAYGEHVTDRLLRSIGDVLKRNIRTNEPDGYNDMVVHRSGDEFWLILNNATLEGGMIASQNLLNKLKERPITVKISAEDANYIEDLGQKLESRISNGESLEEFEKIALDFIHTATKQINEQKQSGKFIRRMKDKIEKIFFLNVSVTASMGCVPYEQGVESGETSEEDVNEIFDLMSSRIKSAEERAKLDGRNCVRGFDGKEFFVLDDGEGVVRTEGR